MSAMSLALRRSRARLVTACPAPASLSLPPTLHTARVNDCHLRKFSVGPPTGAKLPRLSEQTPPISAVAEAKSSSSLSPSTANQGQSGTDGTSARGIIKAVRMLRVILVGHLHLLCTAYVKLRPSPLHLLVCFLPVQTAVTLATLGFVLITPALFFDPHGPPILGKAPPLSLPGELPLDTMAVLLCAHLHDAERISAAATEVTLTRTAQNALSANAAQAWSAWRAAAPSAALPLGAVEPVPTPMLDLSRLQQQARLQRK